MAFSYNRITLVGRIVRDPEIKSANNTTRVTLTLAVDRPFKKDGAAPGVDFIPVIIWGKLAEVSAQYLKKGRPTLIDGRLQIREYDAGQIKKKITEVVAENFQILESLNNK